MFVRGHFHWNKIHSVLGRDVESSGPGVTCTKHSNPASAYLIMVGKEFQPLEESSVMCLHLVFEFLLVNKKEIYLCWYLILGLVADVCVRQKVRAVDAVRMV